MTTGWSHPDITASILPCLYCGQGRGYEGGGVGGGEGRVYEYFLFIYFFYVFRLWWCVRSAQTSPRPLMYRVPLRAVPCGDARHDAPQNGRDVFFRGWCFLKTCRGSRIRPLFLRGTSSRCSPDGLFPLAAKGHTALIDMLPRPCCS